MQLFIVQGAATLAVAIVSIFFLPDNPLTTKWLSPEQRLLAESRIVRDTVGGKEKTSAFAGLREAASDPKLWLFAFMQASDLHPLSNYVLTSHSICIWLVSSLGVAIEVVADF